MQFCTNSCQASHAVRFYYICFDLTGFADNSFYVWDLCLDSEIKTPPLVPVIAVIMILRVEETPAVQCLGLLVLRESSDFFAQNLTFVTW